MSNRPLLAQAGVVLSGLLFGLGLAVARMIDPDKVKDFLDFGAVLSGDWDPSLAFVMGGAVVTAFFFYRFAGPAPLAVPVFHPPHRVKIDHQLVIGSAVFGIGWGLSGLCPGPAIADLGIVPLEVLAFVIAMALGSWATGKVISLQTSERALRDPLAD